MGLRSCAQLLLERIGRRPHVYASQLPHQLTVTALIDRLVAALDDARAVEVVEIADAGVELGER